MKRLAQWTCAWVLAAQVSLGAETGATIEGTVQLPKAAPIPSADRYRSKISGEVGPPEPPVAVIYLEGNFPADGRQKPKIKVQLEQKRFQFAPGVLPIQTGTAVEFPNLDEGYHNVFSYSKPKRFDLGRYRKDEQPPALVFDKAGVVKLYCEIHEHMRGTILVLDTPFFVRSDAAGKFRLAELPPGAHKLKCWINEKTILERPVELKEGETLHIDFTGN